MHAALQVKANRRAIPDKPCSEKHYKVLEETNVLLRFSIPAHLRNQQNGPRAGRLQFASMEPGRPRPENSESSHS